MSNLERADRFFLLTWKRLLWILIAGILCVFLHNLSYALLRPLLAPGGDEAVFFFLAVVVIPLYATVCLVYTLARLAGKLSRRWRSR